MGSCMFLYIDAPPDKGHCTRAYPPWVRSAEKSSVRNSIIYLLEHTLAGPPLRKGLSLESVTFDLLFKVKYSEKNGIFALLVLLCQAFHGSLAQACLRRCSCAEKVQVRRQMQYTAYRAPYGGGGHIHLVCTVLRNLWSGFWFNFFNIHMYLAEKGFVRICDIWPTFQGQICIILWAYLS
jgi:hypothetical protein